MNELKPDKNLDEYLENAWLNIGDVRNLTIDNKLLHEEWDDKSKVPELIVETCRDPDYLHFFAKYILNIDILPYQSVILQVLWHKPLPILIGSRGSAKSFCLALYVIMRAVLHQGCRIAVVGASLRQSMVIFNYIMQIWDNAPILRDICGGKTAGPKKAIHMAEWKCGYSHIMFLPLGSGDKIRGQRANVVVGEEFASIPEAIFETVVRGFAATKSDSVHSSVVKAAKKKAMADRNIYIPQEEQAKLAIKTMLNGNQIILSGTAYYQFNHFYRYWKQYKAIIETNGNAVEIKKEFPDFNIVDDINAKDYAIIRIPYESLPAGMMDETILNQGKATMDPIIYNMEYGAIFPADSEGFFLASSLNSATCPLIYNNISINFGAMLIGNKDREYVMGIDPASEKDYFTICIIELHDTHRRVVYQWSTNRKRFEELKREKKITGSVDDYHTFCIKHIRDLCRRFNIKLICCDNAGGGTYVKEGLRDKDKMMESEQPILDMNDDNNINTDGLKILNMIQFSSDAWRKEAHYGLRSDILQKKLIFPAYDAADIEVSKLGDDREYDTLEDAYVEILECKTETAMIKHSATPGGTEQWDVPRMRGLNAEDVKKQLKRDRFTSLLLANWAARLLKIENNQMVLNSDLYRATNRHNPVVIGNTNIFTRANSIIAPNGRKIFY